MDPDVRRDSGALRRRRSSTSRINVIGISNSTRCKSHIQSKTTWRDG